VRVLNAQGNEVNTVRSVEEKQHRDRIRLSRGDRAAGGHYLMSTRGEYVFTSFDTDDADEFERLRVRPAGHYISRCQLPANLLNEGRFVIVINASSYRVRRYFQDEQALTFTVDAAGAPGMQWPEARLGPVRPRLNWKIEAIKE